MKICVSALFALLLLFSCRQSPAPEVDRDLAGLQTQLRLARDEVLRLRKEKEVALNHSVYFDFKAEITEAQQKEFIGALKSLKQIKVCKGLKAGLTAESGDKRLNKDFDAALHVSFMSLDDLKTYEVDGHHQKVREAVGKYLAGPPVVYDYWVK